MLVVLIHGGYWREQHDLSLCDRMADGLAERGCSVANLEYRRGPHHPWPIPLDDVRAGLARAHDVAGADHRVVVVGHSVGSQLALLAGESADAVVALAPVTDVARVHAEGLGEGAAAEYFGDLTPESAATMRDASPLHRLPVRRPTLIVHGGVDDRVPLTHSFAYVEAATRSGDTVDLLAPHHLSHLQVIDPRGDHWPTILDWIHRRGGSATNA